MQGTSRARILLVEDDPTITSTLSELLEGEGYAVEATATQSEAIALACGTAGAGGGVSAGGGREFDLVLLDITLAEGNGFAVCNAIKQDRPGLPVIFLTASGDEFNTVTGLSMGADDYIAKPFRPRELLARIAVTLRRSRPDAGDITLGPLSIDPARARVTKGGEELALSALEYKLLLLFASNRGKLVTRDMVRDALWDDGGAYVEENTLTVYMRRLRNKVEDDPANPKILLTVRGLGYKACD